jgi:predicted amidohydrolase
LRRNAATASYWWRAWWKPRRSRAERTNTLVAFGPDGGRLASYRKIHLFDAQGFGESEFIKPGPSTAPVVFEHGGVRFGLMTCYDLRFPELARSLAGAGARVLLVCSSWVPGEHKTEQWLALNAARAIENSGGCHPD